MERTGGSMCSWHPPAWVPQAKRKPKRNPGVQRGLPPVTGAPNTNSSNEGVTGGQVTGSGSVDGAGGMESGGASSARWESEDTSRWWYVQLHRNKELHRTATKMLAVRQQQLSTGRSQKEARRELDASLAEAMTSRVPTGVGLVGETQIPMAPATARSSHQQRGREGMHYPVCLTARGTAGHGLAEQERELGVPVVEDYPRQEPLSPQLLQVSAVLPRVRAPCPCPPPRGFGNNRDRGDLKGGRPRPLGDIYSSRGGSRDEAELPHYYRSLGATPQQFAQGGTGGDNVSTHHHTQLHRIQQEATPIVQVLAPPSSSALGGDHPSTASPVSVGASAKARRSPITPARAGSPPVQFPKLEWKFQRLNIDFHNL